MRVARVLRGPLRGLLAVLVAASIALAHSGAHAQAPPETTAPSPTVTAPDRAIAEALFDQGLDALKEKDYDAACPKFAESQRLDPSAGTSFNLARCFQITKRLASAWASFRQSASIARSQGDEAMLQIASRAADKLEPQLPKLVIVVPAAHRVDALRVVRNGSVVNVSLWGAELPVDGGSHVLEVQAPGHHPWSTTVTVPNEPTVVTVEVPALDKAPEPESPELEPPRAASVSSPTNPTLPAVAGEPGSAQRTAAYVIGGIGGATLAVGAGVGIFALVQNEASKDKCGVNVGKSDPDLCNFDGMQLRNEAQRAGGVAVGLLIAGGVVGGVGLTLYLTAPTDVADTDERARRGTAKGRVSLRVRATPGGMALQGRW